MTSPRGRPGVALLIGAALLATATAARPDAVTECNVIAGQTVTEGRLGPAPAARAVAIVHAAVYEAANAITRRYASSSLRVDGAAAASVDAAIATACRVTLVRLVPSQQAAIDGAFQAAFSRILDNEAKLAGVALGERAAIAVLDARGGDGAAAAEAYRPHAAPGAYVPTVVPVASVWPQRKPWLLTSSAQFRPGPPPALSSTVWARDYNEVKALGGRTSALRSAEQTEIATFWEATLHPIYGGIVRSVAREPGRDVTRNARLFAAATQAMDDALIAVFDAKFHYNFWRPVTAIRNGDMDGNEATAREAAWAPFVDTPLHPEYPCAHCVLAGALGAVLKAEIGGGPVPILTTNSTSAKGAARSWSKVDDFVQEVSNARVYDGVHYRNSTEVGTHLGTQVGNLAVAKYLRASD